MSSCFFLRRLFLLDLLVLFRSFTYSGGPTTQVLPCTCGTAALGCGFCDQGHLETGDHTILLVFRSRRCRALTRDVGDLGAPPPNFLPWCRKEHCTSAAPI